MNYRTISIAYFLTSILAACADDGASDQSWLSSTANVEDAAEVMLSDALTLNDAVSSAFGRAKADLDANPFAFYDEIQSSLHEAPTSPHIYDRAAAEILKQMQMTKEDLLAAKVYGLVSRFAELISVPRESIPAQRLADYLDDSIDLAIEMWDFLRYGRPDQKEAAYYFAPAYNLVETTHIVGLAAAGYSRVSIESSYQDTIKTNQDLVGTGENGDVGYLSDWVVSHTPGALSTREKVDHDPVIYSIRHFLEQQQAALE